MRSIPWLLLSFVIISHSQIYQLPPPIAPLPPPLPPGCYESTFTSTHTRCELTFLYCYNFVKLSQCLMRKCERYIRAGDCRLETSFILEEDTCYQSCCGSHSFDENKCNDYNAAAVDREQHATLSLSVILLLIAGGLLVLLSVFCVVTLRCCDKREPLIFLKYNVKWHRDTYEETKCAICRTYGAMLVTPCKHSFHVSCFEEQASNMHCPVCEEKIRDRIKLYCFLCREKSFKVKIGKLEHITEAIAEGKALHFDQCPREIRKNAVRETFD